MTDEIDLPCTECGGELIERRCPIAELTAATDREEAVSIAECSNCGATYYPRETVVRLANVDGGSQTRGDS